MIVVKDIDGNHRVVTPDELFKTFKAHCSTVFGLSVEEIINLKYLADAFMLENLNDIENFISRHRKELKNDIQRAGDEPETNR